MSNGTPYGLAALAREADALAGAPEGTRNATLNTAYLKIAGLCKGGELDEVLATGVIAGAALKSGLGLPEITATMRSAYRAATARAAPETGSESRAKVPGHMASDLRIPTPEDTAHRYKNGRAFGGISTGTQPPPETESDPNPVAHLTALDWPALWADTTEDQWILEPLIAEGAQTVLYSPPKMGKSLLALEMAAAISAGLPCLGVTPTQPRTVLYIDHENRPRGDIRTRLIDMGYRPDTLTRLRLYSFPKMAKLDTTHGGMQLLALAQREHAELVIVDTASRTIKGEENSNDTWVQWYSNTGSLLKAAGIALLRLDHTGKDEQRGQRGGSAKSGDVDLIWRLTEVVEDETFLLQCEASRMENKEKLITIHRRANPLRHEASARGLYDALEARSAALLARLDHTNAPLDIGVVEATQWLRERGHKCSNGAITRRMLTARKAAVPSSP